MDSKVTIFIACHKPVDIVSSDVYTPIHVGRSISTYKKEMSHMIGDDTGDNISNKNPFYSEMTAQYWVWKNYTESEYVGFCHYRRTFGENLNSQYVIDCLSGSDVLLIDPYFRINTRIGYVSRYICPEDIAITIKVINKLYPEYNSALARYAYGYRDYCLNMLICRRELFNQYAEWVFSILFECEKYIRLSDYSRARRVFGYISEWLMPVYFIHNHLRIKTLPYYNTDVNSWVSNSFKVRLKIHIKELLLRHIINSHCKKAKTIEIDPAIEIGLKTDGILI